MLQNNSILIAQSGNVEVLKLHQTNIPKPSANEVTLKHEAIGLSFLDVNQRKGIYNVEENFCPGFSACGIVQEVGENVENVKIGERVAYATSPGGAYCQIRNIHKDFLISVPEFVEAKECASMLLNGLMAHTLLRRTFYVRPKFTILVHAAAGGIGRFLCQLGRHYGANVIGTVGSDEKIPFAIENGCHHVINYEKEDFVQKVKEITSGKNVQVVYDSVGKSTFKKGFEILCEFGLMAIFGDSSGAAGSISPQILTKNSTFLTRPSIFTYKNHRIEFVLSANEVFDLYKKGAITSGLNQQYSLSEVKQAHLDLENRKTMGSSILIP